MAKHCGGNLARGVVVDGQSLVRAGSGGVRPRGVKDHFDQRPVVALAPLERLGMLAGVHSVHTDIPILTRCQNLLVVMLEQSDV